MLKVVVMDSNGVSRDLLKSLLTTGGYEIVGDSNISHAGVSKAITFKPQIFCIDIGEDLDAGGEILRRLRSTSPKSLVFVVSGKLVPEAVEKAMEHGVHGFIVKPFNSVTVLATIRNAVHKLVKAQQEAKARSNGQPVDAGSADEDPAAAN